MSLLARAVKGPIKKPHYILLFGVPGIGKSTFASRFPSPYFLDLEEGTKKLDVTRDFPKSFSEVIQIVSELNSEKHSFQTLAVDSVDRLELLVWDEVIQEFNRDTKSAKAAHIADIPYGGGYAAALNKWKSIGEKLQALSNKMNIVLVAHSMVKTINDPSVPTPYDKHVIKLHQKAADYLKESVDAVLFANYEIFVAKKNDRDVKGKAFGDGKRILSTMATPHAEGKNRYGLPPEIEFDYDVFIKAVSDCDPSDPNKLSERIEHYLPQLKDEATKTKAKTAYEKAKGNIPELLKIEQRLKTIVETI